VERLSDRLLNWASILDDVTRQQAERTASLPFIHPHVALMPDGTDYRQGYGQAA
jgi:tRNA-splicing ligase RtcB